MYHHSQMLQGLGSNPHVVSLDSLLGAQLCLLCLFPPSYTFLVSKGWVAGSGRPPDQGDKSPLADCVTEEGPQLLLFPRL